MLWVIVLHVFFLFWQTVRVFLSLSPLSLFALCAASMIDYWAHSEVCHDMTQIQFMLTAQKLPSCTTKRRFLQKSFTCWVVFCVMTPVGQVSKNAARRPWCNLVSMLEDIYKDLISGVMWCWASRAASLCADIDSTSLSAVLGMNIIPPRSFLIWCFDDEAVSPLWDQVKTMFYFGGNVRQDDVPSLAKLVIYLCFFYVQCDTYSYRSLNVSTNKLNNELMNWPTD